MSKTISIYSVVILKARQLIVIGLENWHQDGRNGEIFSHEFDQKEIKENKLFTWKSLFAAFEKMAKDEGIELGVPCLPDDQAINEVIIKLNQLRTSAWKDEKILHNLTIPFTNSEEDLQLWRILKDMKDKQRAVKAVLAEYWLNEENQN